ncbi:MAG TPA: hypothetical protein VGF91_19990 [Solirubrobacteraceae bacterium]|jgi:hypothetical protein
MTDTTTPSQVQVRRLRDRSQRRKPLRLWISRRTARNGNGTAEFVTQIRLGRAEAVVVPWAPLEATMPR